MALHILSVSQSATVTDVIPHPWQEVVHFSNFRAFKKQLKHQKPALVILFVNAPEDESLCQEVARFIRVGLANQDTRLVLMRGARMTIDESVWMEEYQLNACLVGDSERWAYNRSVLNRELDTFSYIDNNLRQHDAETEMLMCMTRFSRSDESVGELVKAFSATLAGLCRASGYLHIQPNMQGKWLLAYTSGLPDEAIKGMKSALGQAELPACLRHALDEKRPQINLLDDDAGLRPVTQQLPERIGSYFSFPLVVYGNVICVMLYLIPEIDMESVSMKQINIINKAAEQLTILLERKQAESSLRKQYKRLKSTMLELKSAREELAHSEKMASIGRMAAGIAHEINNPLSFVISNISSMDTYLENIMKLQAMQAELLSSIDHEQDHKASQLKQNISMFEEEADMPFILEDIRAVVDDSFQGLQRVKNIITDLRTFTYHQADRQACDLVTVVDETLKVLRYDLDSKIEIRQSLSVSMAFQSHPGLLGQVLTNLVKNAIQALNSAATAKPLIEIIGKEAGGVVTLVVRDNGPGIPKDKQSKVFEPFFTTKPVGEGTGLGLSVTFNIVKKLGGELTFTSEEGKGVTFTMTFPLNAPTGEES
ncbi:MAG: sensor histidine kinase [Pontibacterium sp.]